MNKKQKHINKLVKRLISKGIRYYHNFNSNGYEKAIEKFNKAIELDHNNANAYKYRADVYFIIEPKKAIKDLNKAIKLKPNYISAYELRAITNISLLFLNRENKSIHNYKSILSDYTTILKYNPNYVNAYLSRGDIYSDFEQFWFSIKDYSKAIELRPKQYKTYILRGEDYCEIQQYEKAIEDFTMAITSNNKLNKADGYIGLGKTYYLLKDYNKAINCYTKAIEVFEGTTNLYLIKCYKKRSEAYSLLGEKEKAETDLKLADKIEFKNKKDTVTIEF